MRLFLTNGLILFWREKKRSHNSRDTMCWFYLDDDNTYWPKTAKKNNEWTEEKNLMNKIPKRIQNKPQNHANWSQKRDSSQLIQPKRFIWQIMRAFQSDSKINIGSMYEKWSRLLFSLKYFDCVNFNMNFSSPIFWNFEWDNGRGVNMVKRNLV